MGLTGRERARARWAAGATAAVPVRPGPARARGRHDATILTPAEADRTAQAVLELTRRLAVIAGTPPEQSPVLDTPSNSAMTRAALPPEVLYASAPEWRP